MGGSWSTAAPTNVEADWLPGPAAVLDGLDMPARPGTPAGSSPTRPGSSPEPRAGQALTDASLWHGAGTRFGHHGDDWRDCASCRMGFDADGQRVERRAAPRTEAA